MYKRQEQIYEQIKNLIITEELKAGEMLPSIRGLAKDLRISVITTKRAYAMCIRDSPHPGWVEHDADEIWSSMLGVAVEAMNKLNITPDQVAACLLYTSPQSDISGSFLFSPDHTINVG